MDCKEHYSFQCKHGTADFACRCEVAEKKITLLEFCPERCPEFERHDPKPGGWRRDSGEWFLNAYYFSFYPTGVDAIDQLLSSVAAAGKGYHHTESWSDYSVDTGQSYVDGIQAAANSAAAALTRAEQAEAERDDVARHGVMAVEDCMNDLAKAESAIATERAARVEAEELAVWAVLKGALIHTGKLTWMRDIDETDDDDEYRIGATDCDGSPAGILAALRRAMKETQ